MSNANAFPLPLNLQYLNKDKAWKLLQPFVYLDPKQGPVDVPARFVTNGLTLPRIPIIRALFDDYGLPAAVVHDYLYFSAEMPRKQADEVFLHALKDCGVARWRRYLMYAGVRIFGGFFYDKG